AFLLALAQPGDHAVLRIVGKNPLKARLLAVALVQRRRVPIKTVEIAHQLLDAAMDRVLHDMPVETGIIIPLADLAELAAHEKQLLSRMAEHEREIGPQIGETLPF